MVQGHVSENKGFINNILTISEHQQYERLGTSSKNVKYLVSIEMEMPKA